MAGDRVFADLRQLSDWFATPARRSSQTLDRLVVRLGATAVPLLGRELCSGDPVRRDAARDALATLATTPARARVVRELRSITESQAGDDTTVIALGLLAELGEPTTARFRDPAATQRRSALALACQLVGPAEVANVADVMLRELPTDETLHLLDVLADAAPGAAATLARELTCRLDAAASLRARSTMLVEVASCDPGGPARVATRIAVLVDAAARIVVVASRRIPARAWRRWAVLIGAGGCIDDCLHEDGTDDDPDGLVAMLCADGYRVASSELDHARAVVAAAARRTARSLSSAYYLGRDLLDLRDAHVVQASTPPAAALGRAVELLAAGDVAAARAVIARCDPSAAATAEVLAACLIAEKDLAGALEPLERAIAAEPSWPLHHWNLATALYQLGDRGACYHALRRFLATSAVPTALAGDPEQPERLRCARRLIDELERSARLAGTTLARPRQARQTRKKRRRTAATTSPARGCTPA
jgi:tetratricopeptide (TPR) repeat protein